MAPTGTQVPEGRHPPGTHLASRGTPARTASLPLGTGRLQTAELGELGLEDGDRLPSVTLAYRHDGPGPRAPQVLVVHALTGSADAAGDWWAPLIGPGRAFDTGRVGVLCANLLGGRYGSTGPTSIDPATGEPWGRSFPAISARDEAAALWTLADALGIERFALVTGGSLGGMIALEVALARPDSVGHVAPIAAPAATSGLALAWNHIQVGLVDRFGVDGLAFARQLAMTTYRSEADFDLRFARQQEEDGRFSIASYLDHQGAKLVDRFDPDTYRTLVRVMDGHDIGRGRGGVVAAMRSLAEAGTSLTGLGVAGDILYGPPQVRALVDEAAAAGVDAGYRELDSTKGHDAFLVEWPQLTEILSAALAVGMARIRARTAREPTGEEASAG
jgi:homoserine O-acetyltransferase